MNTVIWFTLMGIAAFMAGLELRKYVQHRKGNMRPKLIARDSTGAVLGKGPYTSSDWESIGNDRAVNKQVLEMYIDRDGQLTEIVVINQDKVLFVGALTANDVKAGDIARWQPGQFQMRATPEAEGAPSATA